MRRGLKGHPQSKKKAFQLPLLVSGSDILARAKNWTGKTAAFCIPALEKFDQDNNIFQGGLSSLCLHDGLKSSRDDYAFLCLSGVLSSVFLLNF
jgi:hypothetical protein